MPAAIQLLALQSRVQDKLNALQQPHAITSLPYKSLCQLHTSLLGTLESADTDSDLVPQLTSLCTTAQDLTDTIHAHVDPVNGSVMSVLSGWAAFWSIVLHSGIKAPVALYSRSSQMVADTASVSAADVNSFEQLCSVTLRLPADSEDMQFLHHFLTQDSALFKD